MKLFQDETFLRPDHGGDSSGSPDAEESYSARAMIPSLRPVPAPAV